MQPANLEFQRVRVFKGNPHGCSKYNEGGQETFYQQLVNKIGRVMCEAPADQIPIPCDGTNTDLDLETKLCGDLGTGKNFVFELCSN